MIQTNRKLNLGVSNSFVGVGVYPLRFNTVCQPFGGTTYVLTPCHFMFARHVSVRDGQRPREIFGDPGGRPLLLLLFPSSLSFSSHPRFYPLAYIGLLQRAATHFLIFTKLHHPLVWWPCCGLCRGLVVVVVVVCLSVWCVVCVVAVALCPTTTCCLTCPIVACPVVLSHTQKMSNRQSLTRCRHCECPLYYPMPVCCLSRPR